MLSNISASLTLGADLLPSSRTQNSNSRCDPPLTPVRQIIRTPAQPPRIGRQEPRASIWGHGAWNAEGIPPITLGYVVPKIDHPETPCNKNVRPCETLAPRARHLIRRLSYPYFQLTQISHPYSPLNIPGIPIASNGCQDLAPPLTIRSSNSTVTPYTPQVVKDGGVASFHWSPCCLGCIA
ncbi:hypothetical protein AN958_01333 [Leucoagaricus sp. SymC.cos]|nr:hypothetical protein AN958_01333 [Leucoagaricus sp. SymC.cos]